tara:strand:+ start:335 stop:1498 length:1164 start_codon:yes stop_codon:yes gene_type:complete
MERLKAAVQNYNWGDTTFIPSLQGRDATGEPEAELWMGTHPKLPSSIMGASVTLTEVIKTNAEQALGKHLSKTHEDLPYLLKVLAINSPLSLQAHPTASQARKGYEQENINQIPLQNPNRIFSTPDEKSEIICALTPFRSLFGFRKPDESIFLLTQVSHPSLTEFLNQLQRSGAEDERLKAAVLWLYAQPSKKIEMLIEGILESSIPVPQLEYFVQLAASYPEDPATMISLLLNNVSLQPGDALYVAPGTPHVYLDGYAVEITSNSDNVIRAGLTTKPVNSDIFTSIVDFTPKDPKVQKADSTEKIYDSFGSGFSLSRIDLNGEWSTDLEGPEILISTDGPFTITNKKQESLNIGQGAPVWVPYSDARYTISGTALIFRAIVTSPKK